MKKIISLLLTVILMFSAFAVLAANTSATEDVTVPVFSVTQTASAGKLQLNFNLESGTINALDINFEISDGLKCKSIVNSGACNSGGVGLSNPDATGSAFNFSFASPAGYSTKGTLFTATFEITKTNLANYSVKFKIVECSVSKTINGEIENIRVNPVSPVFNGKKMVLCVTSLPTRTTYCVDEAFNRNGLTAKVIYIDGTTKSVSALKTTYDFSSKGKKAVTITYTEGNISAETSFEVTVNDHIAGPVVVTKNATCTTEGSKQQRCTACNKVIASESIPVTDHIAGPFSIVKESTCTAEGLKRQCCTECNKVIKEEPIPVSDHVGGPFSVIKESTCSAEGLKQQCCTNCNKVIRTEHIPVTDHKLTTVVIKLPKYNATGESKKYCTECDLVNEIITTPKCNADINNDQKVSSSDALAILQHATDLKKLTGNAVTNADLDGSGNISSSDALIILQLSTGLITA